MTDQKSLAFKQELTLICNVLHASRVAGTMVVCSSFVESEPKSISADVCGEAIVCNAGHQEVSRCSTKLHLREYTLKIKSNKTSPKLGY